MNKLKCINVFFQKHNFMMFEILFALIVVMIGIFGISALYPVGMGTQRQAAGNSYLTDAAEQLLRANANAIKKDWNWLTVFPNTKPSPIDQGIRWSSSSLFELNNLRVKPKADFNSSNNDYSGLFLLEQNDFSAIARMWKEISEHQNGATDSVIYAEVSWPIEKPYHAREKQVFSLQISRAPAISLENPIYNNDCSITKANGGGYSTTIQSVINNEDSTYQIDLLVEHNGCEGSECPSLDSYSVEATPGTYSNVSFTGVSGNLDLGPDLGDELYDGFMIDDINDIGNGNPGSFTLVYTLSGSLVNQNVNAKAGVVDNVASFSKEEFEYVLTCSALNSSNNAPSAVDDVFNFSLNDGETAIENGGVLPNDSDADGNTLTAVLASDVSNGTLALNGDGTFSYTPNATFTGTDTFTYKAYDGIDYSNVATVMLTVTSNNAPSAVDDVFNFNLNDGETAIENGGVLPNDSDADGNTLTAVLASDVSNGTLALNGDGTFSYTPNATFTGTDTFTYKAYDGIDYSNVATVMLTVTSNNAPSAVDDVFNFNLNDGETAIENGGVLPNDSDADGNTLTAVLASDVSNGTLALNGDGTFSYTPNATFTGTDTFTYRAYDGIEVSNIAQVSLTIDNGNVDFEIEGDDVVPYEDVCATFTVLGAAMSGSCGTWNVTSRIKIGNENIDPWGSYTSLNGNVNDGNNPRNYSHTTIVPANTSISVLGRAFDCDGEAVGVIGDSSQNSIQVTTLRNGDQVPNVGGYNGQASAVEFLADYIDANDSVVLQDNQAIYLFELYATNTSYSYFDLQDLVVLVTLDDASACRTE